MNKIHSMATASAAAFFALALAGCATTTEDGIRVGVGVGHSDAYLEKQAGKSSSSTPSALAQQAAQYARTSSGQQGVIVVGETGMLHSLSQFDRQDFYRAYLKAAKRNGSAGAAAQQADFIAQIGGLSTIETYKVPGLYRQDLPVAVRAVDLERMRFASSSGSLIAGSTGDLVVARNNADGLLIIEQVLCKESAADYRSCAQKYFKGRFDRTGAELDTDFKPKSSGVRIDTATYRKLQTSS